MRSLAELQASMTHAIVDGSFVDIQGEFTAGHADPARRYAIYRNNMFLSLAAHLRTIFPVTAKLGDERFFAYAAHQFVLRAPPREARLAVYGAAFPQFLSRFPACRHAPILAEMASLEWAIHSALTSAELPFLELAEMTEALTLDLQPSLRFVVSRWPVLGLWAHRSEPQQALPRQTSRIAVVRHDDDIRFFELGSARFAFWRRLAQRRGIEVAAARALARDARFNLTDEILFLLRSRLVTGADAAKP
jgi:Putative DNA-binding domain